MLEYITESDISPAYSRKNIPIDSFRVIRFYTIVGLH